MGNFEEESTKPFELRRLDSNSTAEGVSHGNNTLPNSHQYCLTKTNVSYERRALNCVQPNQTHVARRFRVEDAQSAHS